MKRALTLLVMGTILSGIFAYAMTGARPVVAKTTPQR
jgi:hypothetical protein